MYTFKTSKQIFNTVEEAINAREQHVKYLKYDRLKDFLNSICEHQTYSDEHNDAEWLEPKPALTSQTLRDFADELDKGTLFPIYSIELTKEIPELEGEA